MTNRVDPAGEVSPRGGVAVPAMPVTPRQAAEQQELLERIGKHPFTQGLRPEHVRILVDCAMLTEFNAGERVFREGDPANRFYLIESGRVVIESAEAERAGIQIEALGPGEVLGWSWLFPPYYWHFDARATERTRAIFFYGTRLREMTECDPELGCVLLRRMAEVAILRLQSTRRQIAAILKP